MSFMDIKCHPFLVLAADADGRNAFRKSRLMLASNFLVGTRFNSSRFAFASIGGSL
jgi:hypothetical protein